MEKSPCFENFFILSIIYISIMHCGNCGTELEEDDSKFCSYCGNPISRPVAPPPTIQPNNDEELRRLREEVTALRYEAKKSSSWAQQQKSCCQCILILIILGVFFSLFSSLIFWSIF